MKKKTPKEDYFSNPNTEKSAYWAGFIAADGCIVDYGPKQGQKAFKLCLNNKDTDHLKKFDIGVEVKLHRNECWIEFRSNKIAADLLRYKITPRKSLTLEFPDNIDPEYIHHFIRGYIDGDGCYSKHTLTRASNQLRIRILGTVAFLTSLLNATGLDINKGLAKRPGLIREANISKNSHELFRYLYKNATIYLDRKKEKGEELIKLSTCKRKII